MEAVANGKIQGLKFEEIWGIPEPDFVKSRKPDEEVKQ